MNREEKIEYLKNAESYSADDLRILVGLLRGEGGCPWDREQTHKSIRSDLIEETYEVIEAIDTENRELLREELGDLLLQVVFHTRIEEEVGGFTLEDVAGDICRKLMRRHPHVFGEISAATTEQVLSNWEKIKSKEKSRETVTDKLRAVPPMLPALMRAAKVGRRASCFDFSDPAAVLGKLCEEAEEVEGALASGVSGRVDEEIGDLLLTAASLARLAGVDPEASLNRATDKFIARFERLEREVLRAGQRVEDLSMAELDAIWDKIK